MIFNTNKRLPWWSCAMSWSTTSAPVVLFVNFEDILYARDLPQIWVVNLFSVKQLHLFFCYESALVSISLSSQILAAPISDGLLIDSALFLSPVSFHFVVSSFIDIRIHWWRPWTWNTHTIEIWWRWIHLLIPVTAQWTWNSLIHIIKTAIKSSALPLSQCLAWVNLLWKRPSGLCTVATSFIEVFARVHPQFLSKCWHHDGRQWKLRFFWLFKIPKFIAGALWGEEGFTVSAIPLKSHCL